MLNIDSMNTYEWCDAVDENGISLDHDCIHIRKQFSNDQNTTSLCLSRSPCNDKLSYICESKSFVMNDLNKVRL